MATEVIKIVDPDNGAGTDYTSLAALVAGYAKDLVTADEQLTVKCRCTGGTADGAATVNGFTTDATRFIKIWTDPAETYRWCDSSRGANRNKYPTSGNYYRNVLSGGGYALTLSDNNIYVIGIAIGINVDTTNFSSAIYSYSVSSGAKHYICQNYITVLTKTSTGSVAGIKIYDGDCTPYIYNNVISGFTSSDDTSGYGIHLLASGTSRIYNNTIYGSYIGIRRESGTSYCRNNISINNYDDFMGTITISNCASDDGDGTDAVTIATHTDVFTDPANGDFSLKNYTGTGKIIGAGTDNPGSGLYSDDIIGTSRTSTWDIGAFEYVAAGGATLPLKHPFLRTFVGPFGRF